MKYRVEWKNQDTGEHYKHGLFDSHEEALESIREWWKTNDFTPRYCRQWTKDGVTTIDYGFHRLFYYIVEIERR